MSIDPAVTTTHLYVLRQSLATKHLKMEERKEQLLEGYQVVVAGFVSKMEPEFVLASVL
ncbi:hypothetical protein V7S43_010263 [Phytophthora oleae]|uniref:Uncharacterized protein n=1 Tax=Phytophthora oleae TaxID=2107226 RepID=A0ABD3FFP0_9STRA